MERETGFEPAASTLARLHSTTELLPHAPDICHLTSVMVRGTGVEPAILSETAPKAVAYASSATLANEAISYGGPQADVIYKAEFVPSRQNKT